MFIKETNSAKLILCGGVDSEDRGNVSPNDLVAPHPIIWKFW